MTTLFLRRWLIASVMIGAVGIAAFLSMYYISPYYEATTTVLINTSDLMEPLVDAPPISDLDKLTSFHTQKDIIRSPAIIDPVVDKLELDRTRELGTHERFKIWAKSQRARLGAWLGIPRWQKPHDDHAASVVAIERNLALESTPESRALQVTYQARDPQEAVDTLVALCAEYKKFFYAQIADRAAGLTTYLDEQLVETATQLADAEEKLLAFRQQDRILLGGEAGLVERRDAETAGVAQRSLAGVTDSATVQDQLKIHVLAMEDELRRLAAEPVPSLERIEALQSHLTQYLAVLEDLPERELTLGRVYRDLQLHQEMFLFLRKNLERARMVQAGNATNINLVTILGPIEPDETVVRPKPRIIVPFAAVFGLVLGITCAFLVQYVDHTIRTAHDLQIHLDVRPLGSLRRI